MERPFSNSDNDKGFEVTVTRERGVLEYPLTDPGTAKPGEGVLWIFNGKVKTWLYVAPSDVTELE